MNAPGWLSDVHVDRVRAVAGILLRDPTDSPSPDDLSDFTDLVQRAAGALSREHDALEQAIEQLPSHICWDSVASYAADEPEGFELLALLIVGAYFMSPTVTVALGLPIGERRAAPPEQAVDELSSGIMDAVLERGCPVKTLQDIDEREAVQKAMSDAQATIGVVS